MFSVKEAGRESGLSFYPRIELLVPSPTEWIDCVLKNFDTFLVDHAACERKASANGIHFVLHYPDRNFLIPKMIRFAREELQHFEQVSKLMLKRGLQFAADKKNEYVSGLLQHQATTREGRLLDRLLIFGIAEARGCERFWLVAKNIQDSELKSFYEKISLAEERHNDLFLEISHHYFPASTVQERLQELLEVEAALVKKLPITAAVH